MERQRNMRHRGMAALAALGLLPGIVFGHGAAAHNAEAKIGYVNAPKAIETAKHGKRVKAQLERELERAKKSMADIENSLKKEKESLEKQAPLLSEKARAQKIQQFQQRVIESQKKMEDRQRKLQALEKRLMGPVIENLKAVIGELAKKEGYQVIYDSGGKDILWVSPGADLTARAVSLLNKRLK